MTGEQEQARLIAGRIARRIQQNHAGAHTEQRDGANIGAELSAMRASLDDLKQRLVQIESRLPAGNHTQGLSGMYVPAVAGHPSQEKFGVEEATVSELVDFFEGEKKCELEPGGKPCDHCSMCNSRGF